MANGLHSCIISKREHNITELKSSTIDKFIDKHPMVYYRKINTDNTVTIKYVAENSFNGKIYRRYLTVIYKNSIPLSDLQVLDKLQHGFRIRRVETLDDKSWYIKTNRMNYNSRIYYYYELSKKKDYIYSTWRFAREDDNKIIKKKESINNIVSFSELNG